MSDLIIEGAKGIPDGLYVIKDGELFKYKPNRGTVYTVRSYHIIDKPKNEWIPVDKKPKDENKIYLVQLDGGGMCSCRWTNVNPFWTDLTTDWHWCIFDIPQYSKVVAWMDLEPYKGGEGE